jgi:translation initiation factor eIF-2B subunit epsilon
VLKVIPKKSKENKKMGAPKKSSAKVSEDHDELVRVPLQAILLADSFTTKFRPITLERPKVI